MQSLEFSLAFDGRVVVDITPYTSAIRDAGAAEVVVCKTDDHLSGMQVFNFAVFWTSDLSDTDLFRHIHDRIMEYIA